MTETYDTIHTTLEEIGDGLFDTAPRTLVVEGEKWIKHVRCEGARFHVLSWFPECCSEPDCIINKPKVEV